MSSIGNKEVFSKNLRFYLEKTEKTQREVAAAIGVTPASFNEWIKGKKYPRIDKIELLARYFGILKSDLIEEKDKNKTLSQDLTEREQVLFDLLRQVPEDSKQMVIDMILAALKKR